MNTMQSSSSSSGAQPASTLASGLAGLPVSQLESLRFKANQIIDSIQSLQWMLEAGNQPIMAQWPDILTKYNILLSQTHSFYASLSASAASASASSGRNVSVSINGTAAQSTASSSNLFEKVALYPNRGMPDAQLDSEVIPLLRNQQTLDVLRMENDTVRRLAEHMVTRGSLGVLGAPAFSNAHLPPLGLKKPKVEYEDVLRECAEIGAAHDKSAERAVRAVLMLREKFDWKQRVEVEVEEPEELEWDPRMLDRVAADAALGGEPGALMDANEDMMGDADVGMESAEGGSSDEDEVEGSLVDPNGVESATPSQSQSQDAPAPPQIVATSSMSSSIDATMVADILNGSAS